MIIAPQSPLFRGTQQENIAAMQRYLLELSETLSVSLNSLDGGTESKLPIATRTTLGGVKIGVNLNIAEDGTLSASTSGGGGSDYILPAATSSSLGGVKVGTNLSVTSDGTLSVDMASAIEENNTKPISSAKVYTEIGNINALLATI